jgi:hypothetical protein
MALPAAGLAEEGTASLEALAGRYATPKAVAGFLQEEFDFARDAELFGEAERWQSPEEFLRRRAGDCEDFALLARELLRRNGIEAEVFSLFGDDGYAHTVCVFRDAEGRYSVINQGRLRAYRARSLEALASRLHPGWTFGGIVEREGAAARLVRELVNPHPVPPVAFDAFATFQF